MKVLIVPEDAIGKRIDVFLAENMPSHVSRSRVQALIRGGHVEVDGSAGTQSNLKLKGGERLILAVPEPDDADPEPQDIPLAILYEDEHLIVVDKPAGMVVHPAVGNWDGTLVNALLFHCGASLAGIGGVRRPGIVHRLDKDTSGVMVAAKTEAAHAGLSEQFADHGKSGPLERTYLALVWGKPGRHQGTIDMHLGRSVNNRLKRAVVDADSHDAKHAVTHYTVKELYGEDDKGNAIAALVECQLETGRTHQIRVHMAEIGHPLVGDTVYGGAFQTKVNLLPDEVAAVVRQFQRQALHARLLGFEHPITGEHLQFETSPPEDFQKLLDAFNAMDG